MAKNVKLTAFLVANQLDVKGIKAFLEIKPLADSSSDLFYKFTDEKYQYFFSYGIIVFTGYTEEEMKWAIKAVHAYHRVPLSQWSRDEFIIHIEEGQDTRFEFNEVVVGRLDEMVIRIAMLNLAQSIALDKYNTATENLLGEVKGFTNQLEPDRQAEDQSQKHDALFRQSIEHTKRYR